MRLPFADFKPVFRARTMPGMPPLNSANICSVQLMFRWAWRGPCVDTGCNQLSVQLIVPASHPSHPVHPASCSKFEQDGALNPTFREGAFSLPLQRISGAYQPAALALLAAVYVAARQAIQPCPATQLLVASSGC